MFWQKPNLAHIFVSEGMPQCHFSVISSQFETNTRSEFKVPWLALGLITSSQGTSFMTFPSLQGLISTSPEEEKFLFFHDSRSTLLTVVPHLCECVLCTKCHIWFECLVKVTLVDSINLIIWILIIGVLCEGVAAQSIAYRAQRKCCRVLSSQHSLWVWSGHCEAGQISNWIDRDSVRGLSFTGTALL